MKKKLLIAFVSVMIFTGCSQPNIPSPKKQEQVEVSEYYQDKLPIEFKTIETIISEKYKDASSMIDMISILSEEAGEYNKLMQKFYDKLLEEVDREDQEIIRQTQRNWIKFRDSENELNDVLSKNKYVGGKMQLVLDASNYTKLVKDRTLQIFYYLKRVEK